MFDKSLPRITNLWSKVVDGDGGKWLSKVVIESTKPYGYSAAVSGGAVVVEGKSVRVNMPEGAIEVNDGLLREVGIKQDGNNAAVTAVLDCPAEFELSVAEGFPFRLELLLDRSFIKDLFKGKKIVIDPGHGGKDSGAAGLVGLLEKDVVLPVAVNLEKLLRKAGADVLLTRDSDRDVPAGLRMEMAVRAGAHAYIGIHTKASADAGVEGLATLYSPSDARSAVLADFVQKQLVKKMKAADGGTAVQPGLAPISGMPAVETEILAITNLVEEVFLRGLTVRKKAAEGIFNGLIKYFARTGRDQG
ncbi:MAG TPA: N-acetylmuramoyl-L-alanine amidase [Bacillota bacterium]|nr:N-acetylmuramoyl-L-alanine amidase [Bacillota bacterium]